MVPGFFIWFRFVVLEWGAFFSSVLAHVGGLFVGLVVVKRVGVDRRSWFYAFGWYLLIQVLSRFLTGADLNVNLAHRIQPGYEAFFSSYWQFWLTAALTTALGLWMLTLLLARVWPTPATDGNNYQV